MLSAAAVGPPRIFCIVLYHPECRSSHSAILFAGLAPLPSGCLGGLERLVQSINEIVASLNADDHHEHWVKVLALLLRLGCIGRWAFLH
jgi:hypothetical protein